MRTATRLVPVVSLVMALLTSFPTSAPLRAQTWQQLLAEGVHLTKRGQPDSALAICLTAMELAENEAGHYDSTVGVVAHRLGGMYQGLARFAESRQYELIALAIWDSLPGPQLPIAAFTLHNLGNAENDLGMNSEAKTHLRLAVDLKRQSPLVKPGSLANSIVALADLLARDGDLIEAEELAKEAISIRTHQFGADAPKTLAARNILGHVYHYQGRSREAAEVYSHIVEAYEQAGMTAYALALSNNLAAQYNQLGLYTKAESTLTFLLDNVAVISNNREEVRALGLKNLGRSYFHQRQYAKAESCHRTEMEIVRKLHGVNHIDYLGSMYNLANTCREFGKYASADSLYHRMIQMCMTAHGETHPMIGHGSRELARLYIRRKLLDSALVSSRVAFATFADRFYGDLTLLSKDAALSYCSHMRRSAEVHISSLLALEELTSSQTLEAANIILSVKGPVSDELINRDRFLHDCADPEIRAMFKSYQDARAEAARTTATQIHFQPTSAVVADSIFKRVEELERRLALASARFREYSHPELVNAVTVARQLPPDAVLIEYMFMGRFDDADSTQRGHLVSLIITSDGHQALHDLGSIDEIEGLVGDYRHHLRHMENQNHSPTSEDLAQYNRFATKLYKKIWQPLESDIGSRATILLSPDGVLNLVSFSGLINAQGRYLVEDLTIQYLSAGRDLLYETEPRQDERHLLAIGDPDYDASVEDRVAGIRNSGFSLVGDTSDALATRGLGIASRSIADLKVARLHGTQEEIKRILSNSSLFSSTVVLTGVSATEDEFKKRAPDATTIHLATHGFYLRSDYRDPDFETDPLTMFGRRTNPLMESGILFAGANLHGEGADLAGIEDGILFAEEVMMMDLRNTDLVVLSACETGLGELQQGEGVFGLRKAFRVAGAEAIVSALWSVPDQQTADFMDGVYKTSDLSISERIRAAQLALLNRMRSANYPEHPYLWAGFTSVGGWH